MGTVLSGKRRELVDTVFGGKKVCEDGVDVRTILSEKEVYIVVVVV